MYFVNIVPRPELPLGVVVARLERCDSHGKLELEVFKPRRGVRGSDFRRGGRIRKLSVKVATRQIGLFCKVVQHVELGCYEKFPGNHYCRIEVSIIADDP